MIFAAGRGERLRPLTDQRPKALFEVSGIPLIERHVRNLAEAGFERAIINLAHLGDQIRRHFEQRGSFGVELIYSAEPPGALETAGAIVNAGALLGNEAFITINADILTNYRFSDLLLPDHSNAHIVLVNKNNYIPGNFSLDQQHIVHNEPRDLIFTGIAAYHPRLFKDQPVGRYSITPILRSLAQKQQLTGEYFNGEWADLGTFTNSLPRLR